MMLGLWLSLSPVVFVLGINLFVMIPKSGTKRFSKEDSVYVSALLVLPLWWAIYFAIRMVIG